MRQIGWHVLRHTFGSHLAHRGAAPKAIQDLSIGLGTGTGHQTSNDLLEAITKRPRAR